MMSTVRILDRRRTLLLLDLDVQCFEYLDFFKHLLSSKVP